MLSFKDCWGRQVYLDIEMIYQICQNCSPSDPNKDDIWLLYLHGGRIMAVKERIALDIASKIQQFDSNSWKEVDFDEDDLDEGEAEWIESS
jgi:hypothetical protein